MVEKLQVSKKEGWQQTARSFERWARGATPTSQETQTGASKVAAGLMRPQSAQSIVEFMLVSVPLLALIFGIMEFGLVFFKSTSLDFLTREVARTVALCANTCDVTYIVDSTVAAGYRLEEGNVGGGTFYRDYYALKKIQQSSYAPYGMLDIEYVLLQHVGEQTDDPRADPNTNTVTNLTGPWEPNVGRQGPDIYPNYQYHWQLYALPKSTLQNDSRANTVQNRTPNPANILFNDALPNQIPLLTGGSNGVLPFKGGVNDKFNGWRSNRCFRNESSDTCYQNFPNAKPDGTADVAAGNCAAWPGRYYVFPTDRFYVQIVLRHTWITPFMPTINTDGRSQSLQGFKNNNFLFLTSRVYNKVEAQLYASLGSVCGG